jgi:hypothetical protein
MSNSQLRRRLRTFIDFPKTGLQSFTDTPDIRRS